MANDKRWRKLLPKVALWAGAVLGVLLLVFVFTQLSQTLKSILPGLHASPSTNMRPYDLHLRHAVHLKDYLGEEQEVVKEWHLRLPRAYVWSEIGKNGVVNNSRSFWANPERDNYLPSLSVVLKKDGSGFKPATRVKDKDRHSETFFINLANGNTNKRIFREDACVQETIINNFRNPKRKNRDNCKIGQKDGKKKCSVYYHHEGWGIEILMPTKYFVTHLPHCRMVRGFLTEHTVSVDSLKDAQHYRRR